MTEGIPEGGQRDHAGRRWVIVCGGRKFNDKHLVHETLDAEHERDPIRAILHGDAPGADSIAANWANAEGVAEMPFPADWLRHGRAAGPIRNQQMLDWCADAGRVVAAVIAFPGGKGTADMVRRARAANIEVIEVAAEPSPASPVSGPQGESNG